MINDPFCKSQQDLQNILNQLKVFGEHECQVDPRQFEAAWFLAQEFCCFTYQIIKKLGLFDSAPHTPIYQDDLLIDIKQMDLDAFNRYIQNCWNNLSGRWPVIETVNNYGVTMAILISYLINRPLGSERILSVGSGPGIYETFLAKLGQDLPELMGSKFICLDFAKKMTRLHKNILDLIQSKGLRLTNIFPCTGDMTDLMLQDQTIDQIICNNALQWVTNWQKAIKEFARVMRTGEQNWLYLFIQARAVKLLVTNTQTLERYYVRPAKFSLAELFDELESNGFEINNLKKISALGRGQCGLNINRIFVRAYYTGKQPKYHWRDYKDLILEMEN